MKTKRILAIILACVIIAAGVTVWAIVSRKNKTQEAIDPAETNAPASAAIATVFILLFHYRTQLWQRRYCDSMRPRQASDEVC